jgi:hypothetical protein
MPSHPVAVLRMPVNSVRLHLIIRPWVAARNERFREGDVFRRRSACPQARPRGRPARIGRWVSPDEAAAAVKEVLNSIGDACPECPPDAE